MQVEFKIGDLVRNTFHFNDTHWPEGYEFIITGFDHKYKQVRGTSKTGEDGEIPLNSIKLVERKSKSVSNPPHYGGKDNPYEAIKVIENWNLGFNLGNTVKYISRAGKKDKTKWKEDLEKAKWYLEREIENLDKQKEGK